MPTPQPVLEMVFRKLGGRQALGEEVASEADLARVVFRRIPLKVLMYVKRSGFSDREIEHFIIPARTRHHVTNPGRVPLFFVTVYAPPAY